MPATLFKREPGSSVFLGILKNILVQNMKVTVYNC